MDLPCFLQDEVSEFFDSDRVPEQILNFQNGVCHQEIRSLLPINTVINEILVGTHLLDTYKDAHAVLVTVLTALLSAPPWNMNCMTEEQHNRHAIQAHKVNGNVEAENETLNPEPLLLVKVEPEDHTEVTHPQALQHHFITIDSNQEEEHNNSIQVPIDMIVDTCNEIQPCEIYNLHSDIEDEVGSGHSEVFSNDDKNDADYVGSNQSASEYSGDYGIGDDDIDDELPKFVKKAGNNCLLAQRPAATQSITLPDGNGPADIKCTKQGKEYKCKYCSKRCYGMYRLRRHEQTHSAVKQFSCAECGKEFKVEEYRNWHVKKFHKQLAKNMTLDVKPAGNITAPNHFPIMSKDTRLNTTSLNFIPRPNELPSTTQFPQAAVSMTFESLIATESTTHSLHTSTHSKTLTLSDNLQADQSLKTVLNDTQSNGSDQPLKSIRDLLVSSREKRTDDSVQMKSILTPNGVMKTSHPVHTVSRDMFLSDPSLSEQQVEESHPTLYWLSQIHTSPVHNQEMETLSSQSENRQQQMHQQHLQQQRVQQQHIQQGHVQQQHLQQQLAQQQRVQQQHVGSHVQRQEIQCHQVHQQQMQQQQIQQRQLATESQSQQTWTLDQMQQVDDSPQSQLYSLLLQKQHEKQEQEHKQKHQTPTHQLQQQQQRMLDKQQQQQPQPQNFPKLIFMQEQPLDGKDNLIHTPQININPPKKKVICHVCDKEFSSKRGLHRHKLMHEEWKYPCAHCDKRYYRQDMLVRHMQQAHTWTL